MKSKDFLIVALAPFGLLWLPFVGNYTVEGCNWSGGDFVLMWVVLATTTFFYRLLATRQWSNLPYRLGAALGVIAGLLVTWVTLAVQIIGDDNPGNTLYLATILLGGIGVGVSGFRPATLAKIAFSLAAAVLLIPVVSVVAWPADFQPGFARVFILNLVFVALFAASGLLFLRATNQPTPRSAALA